jgi:outer membrane protein OmpA-like peptidoglycan-associated protein/outer membrane protein W
MNLRYTLATALLAAAPLAANAQAVDGPYVTLGAGVNWLSNQTANVTLANPLTGAVGNGVSGWAHSDVGPLVSGSVGWGFGNGLRAEVAFPYRYNNFSSGSGHADAFGGHEQKYGPMFNVLYDFVDLVPYVQPYIGAGVGYQIVKESNLYVSGSGPLGVGFLKSQGINGTKGMFAYDAILGAAMPISAVPGLSLTTEFQFLGVTGNRNYAANGTIAVGATTTATRASFKFNNDFNYGLLVGVRYAFNAAPPPPPPAPAAVPVQPQPVARSYLVFFDWDKATLTDRARQIISEAAQASTKVQYTRIEVNGYTDTSGTPKYNMGLSIRRAQAVAAELVKDGVPKNVIAIKGFGETNLLVPTGPNVREPQNRRVEIIIR